MSITQENIAEMLSGIKPTKMYNTRTGEEVGTIISEKQVLQSLKGFASCGGSMPVTRQKELTRPMFIFYRFQVNIGEGAMAEQMKFFYGITDSQIRYIKKYMAKAEGKPKRAWEMFKRANGYR